MHSYTMTLYLWPPYVIGQAGQAIYIFMRWFLLLLLLLLDVYHAYFHTYVRP